MTCTQQELNAARAQGILEALAVVDDELKRATREVNYARRPKSNFAAGNRDRATLRVTVIKQVKARIAAL
jgi:hypothetical protein